MNIKYYIGLCALLLTILTGGCDKEGEDIYSASISFTTYFVYPTHIYDNYRVVFNGYEIYRGNSIAVDKNNPTGTLEVYQIGSDIPEFSKEITVEANDTVRLIILDDSVYLYTPEEFPSFSVNITYQTGQSDLYNINYSSGDYEQAITNGTNYVAVKHSNGSLQVVRNSDNTAAFSKGISITNGIRIDLLQLGENQFLDATIPDSETDPADREHCKIRFYLDPAIETGGGAVRVLVYNATTLDTAIDTLDFDPATSASPFTEIDISGSYKYQVYKLSDNTQLTGQRTINQDNSGAYKFQTLKAAKYLSTFMEDLSVKW